MRYKVKFENHEAALASTRMETPSLHTVLVDARRGFISCSIDPRTTRGKGERELEMLAHEFGGRVVPDRQYDLETDITLEAAAEDEEASLKDVVETIRAVEAWNKTRGRGVSIAVVDTGIAGDRPEFPAWKRAGEWQDQTARAWTDWNGHGSMCAAIAGGTTADGGLFDGVAPDCGLIACRTHFYDSELTAVYDMLSDRAQEGETVVVSNSWGFKTGAPPRVDPDDDFPDAFADAVAAGVRPFFSAGNNHQRAGGDSSNCHPNSVWLHKSQANLMSVATCDLDGAMWSYSSRGPGQHYGQAEMNRKPDVTAPTPRNGRVVHGSGVRVLANGWGTSGACPQVAGLAALLLSLDATLRTDDLFDIIRGTSVDLGHGWDCQGAGRIDCAAAVARL